MLLNEVQLHECRRADIGRPRASSFAEMVLTWLLRKRNNAFMAEEKGSLPEQSDPVQDELVAVSVKGLILDPDSKDPIVILREEDGERFLPIWIGVFEANAIALRLEDVQMARPLSHDLMLSLVQSLHASVIRVVISDLEGSTFHAQVVLRSNRGIEVVVDARPSDAIALALRAAVPLFVHVDVFARAQRTDDSDESDSSEERIRRWLEEVDPDDLGKYTM